MYNRELGSKGIVVCKSDTVILVHREVLRSVCSLGDTFLMYEGASKDDSLRMLQNLHRREL